MKPGRRTAGFRSDALETDDSSDVDALRRVSDGEIGAMAALYDRHHLAVYNFIARLTGNAADVEDVVHVTFLIAAKRASTFDGRASCRPWLFGIATRLVQRRRRSIARFGRMLLDFTADLRTARVVDPDRLLAARDELARVERAFAQLSDAKRSVLLMAEVEGMSCEEIAAALEIPVGTVWTRLHHARRHLSMALRAEELP